MTGTSAAGIIVMMAVVLVGAMAMILWIFVLGRGSFKHRRIDHRPGDVRGGIHVGDPGSVMPRRDAPANPADPTGTGQDRQLGRPVPGRDPVKAARPAGSPSVCRGARRG